MTYRALDLFCGAGGATKGLQMAGFHVTGVDNRPQPRYCGDVFIQADAMTFPLEGYDLIWASPPCQGYSESLRHMAKPKPMLIPEVRERLKASGAAWVIENVEGAPLLEHASIFGGHGVVLCGTSFGLRIYRHRVFESNYPIACLPCNHREYAFNPENVAGRARIYAEFGKQNADPLWAREMGVGWMKRNEAREAIPPLYAKHIGDYAQMALGTPGGKERGATDE